MTSNENERTESVTHSWKAKPQSWKASQNGASTTLQKQYVPNHLNLIALLETYRGPRSHICVSGRYAHAEHSEDTTQTDTPQFFDKLSRTYK